MRTAPAHRPCRPAALLRLGLILAAALPPAAVATSEIRWHSIDAGGGAAGAGELLLRGSIGQADAGMATANGLTLSGGFRRIAAASGAPPDAIFRDGFESPTP